MAELKTKATKSSVQGFLNAIGDPERRKDCETIAKLMQQATGLAPKMWGSSIVGFGNHHYRYESGREGDWFQVGFSPRKTDLTLYFASGLEPHAAILKKLGKHKTGKGCLYIKRLSEVDVAVLEKMIRESVRQVRV